MWRAGRLYRLNQDHAYRSILAQRVHEGEMSADDAAHHPDRNALISAVTGHEMELVDLPRQAHTLERDDQILLASDGILTLSEAEIADVLDSVRGRESPCQRLLMAVAACQRPQQDNVTVLWAQSAAFRFAPWWQRLWRRGRG